MNDLQNLTKDSLAILLICSNLAINIKEETVRPYTTKQWNILADKLKNSSIERPSNFFKTNGEDWMRELYLSSKEVDRLNNLMSRAGQLGIELENLNQFGIKIITRADKNYPKRLKDILKIDCPPVIFYCGDLKILENEGVSMVGSRNIDKAGLDFTKTIAEKCVLEGFNIISGGARGVDSIAQETGLKSGGKVVSFIADNLVKRIKKKEIREEIVKGKLLLMSAVNPKASFKVYTAMDRNKYVYALSKSAIVVSSDYNKGGTWAGAIENLKNKWVPIFVRKDNTIPEGNKELLNRGAIPIETSLFSKKDVSIKQYFNENSNLPQNKEIMVQIDMGSLINNHTKVQDAENISSLKKNKLNSQDQDIYTDPIDIYTIVWPHIEKQLTEPKSGEELSEVFNLKKSQVDEWLKRAIEEEKIKKLTRPVRYMII